MILILDNEYDISPYNSDDDYDYYDYDIDNYNHRKHINLYDLNHTYDPDTIQQWVFSFDIYNEIQIQATNCYNCGNYIVNATTTKLDSITCKCA